jgi:anti-sigma B factor antagonist
MSTIPPAERHFSCEIEPDRESVRLAPSGELDVDTVGMVEQRLYELFESGFTEIVLDLRGLTFMDSTGLHMIFKADSLAGRDGTRFVLVPGSPRIQRLFDLTGTLDRLNFRDGATSE